MSLKGKTRIIDIGGTSSYFLIPTKISNDSAFIFKKRKDYDIELCDGKIVVS